MDPVRLVRDTAAPCTLLSYCLDRRTQIFGSAPMSTELAPEPEPRPRLGFFTYLHGAAPQPDVYRRVIDLFEAAEDLGFATGWVAQHHHGRHGGLPSPFVFLTAAAERTRAIGLGTAVVTLLLE